MCPTCNKPINVCQCSHEVYCDPCVQDNSCVDTLDASCVIYHFDNLDPTKLVCLNIPNKKSLEYIFEQIDARICTIRSLAVPIQVIDSPTIDLTTSGTANHTLTGQVNLSTLVNNALRVTLDGLYLPNPTGKIKVDESDESDYLVNQVIGETDGIIVISPYDAGGVMTIQPAIDIRALIQSIQTDYCDVWCDMINNCLCLSVSGFTKDYISTCPSGYTRNGNYCDLIQYADPSPSGTTYSLEPEANIVWSKAGALVFNGGFNVNGAGLGFTLAADITSGAVKQMTVSNVWLNGTTGPYDGNNAVNLGPMNRAAVWTTPYTTTTKFVIPIQVPVTKTYYVGIGIDNYTIINITNPDGTTNNILTEDTVAASAYFGGGNTWNFDFWRIYPIQLSAGLNYLSLTGTDEGGARGFAVEIYDNTLAQLQAAELEPAYIASPDTYPYGQNHYHNLNLLFSTRCARAPGAITANSATCPSGYTLDTTHSAVPTPPCQSINNPVSNWRCVKVTRHPFTGYSAHLSWNRISDALTYQIQHKEEADGAEMFTDISSSPIVNPGSGSIVSVTVNDLPTNTFVFRIRPIYSDCKGFWVQQ